MIGLYPEIEPYQVSVLQSGDHQIYFEVSGNPKGIPVIFLHGGPGSGCKPYHRSFFDPSRYKIILVDQRGSGRSLPSGFCQENTASDLIADLESIRIKLGIDAWVLFGGSWGATLALLYTECYPERVLGLMLRGVFLGRKTDLDWFAGPWGVRKIYPESWNLLLSDLPEEDHDHPIPKLHQMLMGQDELAQRRAARAWEIWGGEVVLGDLFDPSRLDLHVSNVSVCQARIELHYAVNNYFIEENQILSHIHQIPNVPIRIIHGRRDLVCPLEAAWTLHQALARSTLEILPNGGHIASTVDMVDALVRATDAMAAELVGA